MLKVNTGIRTLPGLEDAAQKRLPVPDTAPIVGLSSAYERGY